MSITNRDIFNNALGLIGQQLNGDCEDYEDRAPYLIAAFCCIATDINKAIYSSAKLGIPRRFSPVYLPLDSEFPLCERLAASASLYVAAMLVLDENSELSDSLYDRYCNSILPLQSLAEDVRDSTLNTFDSSSDANQTICESITERYFFN